MVRLKGFIGNDFFDSMEAIELTSVNPARARSQLNRLVTFQLLTKRRKKKIKPRTVSVHETARIKTGRLVAMMKMNRRIN